MQIGYAEPLSHAWARMKLILFQPFDLVKWLVIGFTAWLARILDGSSGGGSSRWDLDKRGPAELARDLSREADYFLEQLVWAPFVLAAVVFLVAVIIALLWISSRAKFVFLDNLILNRAQVVEPWGRLKTQGNSLFIWRICFALLCVAVVVVIAGITLGPIALMAFGDAWAGAGVLGGVLFIVLMVILGLVAAYVSMFVENFIVPIMYRFNLSVVDAWRHFMPWLSSYGFAFFIYGLWVALLFVFTGAILLLTCCCCCIAAIPYVGTVLLLPLWVTYRLMSLEFLAQFDPEFDFFAGGSAPQTEPAEA
ncbi:MAG: hypothetical protein GY906_17020 [bacterium]|nr:hypothetical protein [bacterium]